MRIGLNAIGFDAGRIGGAETYLRNLVRYLQDEVSEGFVTILCNSGNRDQFSLSNPRFSCETIEIATGSLKWYARGMLRNLVGLDLLNRDVYRSGVDLVHHPFTILSPTCPKVPSVVTFLDVQHEYYPEFFSKFELYYRRKNYPLSIRNSARLIAISEYTKRCMVEKYQVSPDKIDVIYLGYSEDFHRIEDLERLNDVRKRYGLERPFMYYPAATWPHKNHRNLLSALKILKDAGRFDGELVLSGIAKQGHAEILQQIEELGLGNSVRVLGYLPIEDLPCLYNLATLLVFPSYFEGFGLPLVEAMACGCPVVCSNVTSIPEIVMGGGEMFDPASPEAIADAVWRVWDDPVRAEGMRAAGLERVRAFDWPDMARQTAAVYRKVLS